METENKILRMAIEYFGEPGQILKAIEELAELQCELLGSLNAIDANGEYFMHVVPALCNKVLDLVRDNTKTTSLNFKKNNNEFEIVTEIADVSIMLDQLKIIFDPNGTDFKTARQFKINRLNERINADGEAIL